MTAKFWVGGTGTWDSSTTTNWSLSTGGAGGAAVPVTGDSVTFDASSGGGVVTVAAAVSGLSLTTLTMGAFAGTLDFSVNNPSLTFTTSFSNNGIGARTLKLGSGTFTVSAQNGTVWDFGVVTNFVNPSTFAGTSTVLISAAANNQRTIVLGAGCTYATLTIANTGSTANAANLNGGGTGVVTTLNLTAPLNVVLAGGMTITNALNIAGTAFNNAVQIYASSGAVSWTLSSAGGTANWCVIGNLTAITNSLTATNSINLGGNTNVAITGPSGGGGAGAVING